MRAEPFTTLLTGINNDVFSGIEDVEIWQLELPALRREGQDIFDVTRALRSALGEGYERTVSPNHVLVAAPVSDECPHGSPIQANAIPPFVPNAGVLNAAVAVIDSGYQWDKNWTANPLDAMCQQLEVKPGMHPTPGGWVNDDDDVPSVAGVYLDALSGHANFVAGLIAQRIAQPNITIWNHNGSFAAGPGHSLPTEAAVCRSLLDSQSNALTKVTYVGFAFATLDDHVSNLWDIPFKSSIDGIGHPVVAPAGNQGSANKRYPAALNAKYPGQYPNVFGVGSLDDTAGHAISTFSNRGDWVACSTVGENVFSTFLDIDMPPEEEPTKGPHDFASNSWAVWNGTSFSAPKLAAALVDQDFERLVDGLVPDPLAGYTLPDL